MKNKKAAIELSMNFLVVIIISIVIVGLGLILFFSMKDKATDLKDSLDQQTEDQLKAMMLQNNYKVAVYPNQLTLDNGKSQLVGLGITNEFNTPKTFTITHSVKYYIDSETDGAPPNPSWIKNTDVQFEKEEVEINPKDQKTVGILIKMPSGAASGEYVVTLNITQTNINYGVVKIYIVNP